MFAVIFIPNFSLQAILRHEPELGERAVALVDPEMTKPVIVQLTSVARSCGVCEGLTPSQAMARCTELLIKSRSPAQEESATEVLLQTAYAFSPNIESTAPGVCTIELKGLPFHSNGGAMEQWAEKIVELLAQFYIEARIGFAATPELALLAARAANPVLTLKNGEDEVLAGAPSSERGCVADQPQQFHAVCGAGKIKPALACEPAAADALMSAHSRAPHQPVHGKASSALESFTISSLEPTPEILEILQRWGIRTVGELLALGKDDVAERLGPAAVELFNRVSPDSPRPLRLIAPPQEFAEQMDFEHEIETAEPLLFVLRRFIEQLSRRLELIYLVVAELHLQLGLSSGAKYERVFKIPSPTGSIEILFRMLQTHLETVRTDSSIVSLRLAANPAKPEAQQFGLFESTLRDPNQFAETLARLTALVGSENIGTPELIPSHKPDSFRLAVPEFGSRESEKKRRRAGALQDASALNGAQENPPGFGVRQPSGANVGLQLRRFRPPLVSHIEFREGTPSLLRSPVFIGSIVEIRGPFFSSGDWWDTGRWAREEWDVETSDGSLLRIFRSSDGCFVEGVYD